MSSKLPRESLHSTPSGPGFGCDTRTILGITKIPHVRKLQLPKSKLLERRCTAVATAQDRQGSGSDDFRGRDEKARAARAAIVKSFSNSFYNSHGAVHQGERPGTELEPDDHLVVHNLPIWRAQHAILPGMQTGGLSTHTVGPVLKPVKLILLSVCNWVAHPMSILHVTTPSTTHMFEGSILRRTRPWRFGHLYLPGGPRNLGQATHAMRPGSQAPLLGVLMEVSRAVRLTDGKLLVLATAVCRVRVVQALQEVPFSRADVELDFDVEELQAMTKVAQRGGATLAAPLGLSHKASTAPRAIGTRRAIAAAAAAAASRRWHTFELATARSPEWQQESPLVAGSDAEASHLVSHIVDGGVQMVVPLPDGPVVGRWDLAALAAAAAADALGAAAAATAAASDPARHTASPSPTQPPSGGIGVMPAATCSLDLDVLDDADMCASTSGSNNGPPLDTPEATQALAPEDALPGTPSPGSGVSQHSRRINSLAERNVAATACGLPGWPGSAVGETSAESILALEARVWDELDTLAGLTLRIRRRHLSLPFGLLQLRPPPSHPAAGVTALCPVAEPTQSYNSSQSGSSSSGNGSLFDMNQGSRLPWPASHVAGAGRSPSPETVSTSHDASQPRGSEGSSMTTSANGRSPADGMDDFEGGQTLPSLRVPPSLPTVSRSPYHMAASDGSEVCANVHYPSMRRAQRLSYALPVAILDVGPSEARQAFLEVPSVSGRLRLALASLQQHRNVLAACAAVASLSQNSGRG